MIFIRCLVLVLGLWFECCQAAPSKLQVTVMHTEPWGFFAPSTQQMQGIWVDVADALSRDTHQLVEVRLAPYARVWRDLAHSRTDISFLIRSPQREGKFIPVAHLFDFSSVILTRKGIVVDSYDDLSRLRIGILQGIQLNPRFDQDTQLLKIPFRNYEILLHLLAVGRLDAVAGNSVSLAYLVHQRHLERQVGMSWTLQRTPVWLLMAPQSSQQALIPSLRGSVARLRQQGVFEQILNRYAGEKWKH